VFEGDNFFKISRLFYDESNSLFQIKYRLGVVRPFPHTSEFIHRNSTKKSKLIHASNGIQNEKTMRMREETEKASLILKEKRTNTHAKKATHQRKKLITEPKKRTFLIPVAGKACQQQKQPTSEQNLTASELRRGDQR